MDNSTIEEETLVACFKTDRWICPVESCAAALSRKQTLQNHLYSKHTIKCANPSKRYKLYLEDPSIPVPRTTQYYKKLKCSSSVGETEPGEKPCSSSEGEPEPGEDLSLSTPPDEAFPSTSASVGVFQEPVIESSYASMVIPLIKDGSEVIDDDIIFTDDDMEQETAQSELDLSLDSESDDNEQDGGLAKSAATQQTPSAPLFVVPPKTDFIESKLSNIDSAMAIAGCAMRHNMSDTGIRDILELIAMHLSPIPNIIEKDVQYLKELSGFDEKYVTYHTYCNLCQKIFSSDDEMCMTPGCTGNITDPKSRSYFVTGDLEVQIKEILEKGDTWDCLQEHRTRPIKQNSVIVISDICDGSEYRKLLKNGGFLSDKNNISLMLFTDGMPLFKSSCTALWPVYITINELPPKERFLKKNMVLWGLWQGQGKPKMNMFLHPLVLDLNKLYQKGIVVQTPNGTITVRAILAVVTLDLQARAYVLNMTQHNGTQSCVYCLAPGTVVPSGKGRCRAFLPSDQPSEKRTNQSIRECASKAEETQANVSGFLGDSVLHFVPEFDASKCCVIDYMHGILIGITKKFLNLWFHSSNSGAAYSIRTKLMDVSVRLKSIQPPYMINRLSTLEEYIHWKASEMRSWLLYYSLPCLVDILPDVYLQHFSTLVEATYLLLSQGITTDDLQRSRELLSVFVECIPQLYSANVMGLNVHNLLHIVDCVESWGPLWCFSCFAYESFNGELKKVCHGKGNVCRQIFWNLQAEKKIEMIVSGEEQCNTLVQNYLKRLTTSCIRIKGQEAYQCEVLRPHSLPKNAVIPSSPLLQHKDIRLFQRAKKVIRNGFVFYSRMYTKVKKRNSYTIFLEKPLQDQTTVLDVDFFLLDKESGCVYAVGRGMKSTGAVIPRRALHLQELQYTSQEKVVVKCEDLREPVVIMHQVSRIVYAVMPNHIERD